MNRAPQKAPLGLLVLWLRHGPECNDRPQHKEAAATFYRPNLPLRQEARNWVVSRPELRPLLEFEAAALGCAVGAVLEPADIS